MRMRGIAVASACVAGVIVLLIVVNARYSFRIGVTHKGTQPEAQEKKLALPANPVNGTKSDVKTEHTITKSVSPPVADMAFESLSFYGDIAQFDKHLDGLTSVDPQYVRAMRDFLEKLIRLNYPVSWPYKGNPDVMAFESNNTMESSRDLTGTYYTQFEVARYQIGMVDSDSRSKNNPYNCSVVACDMSGKELAVQSRYGFSSAAQASIIEADAKNSESQYSRQEPAMKRAVEIRMTQEVLSLKESAIGSMYIQGPHDAERLVDSPRMKEVYGKLHVTFAHIDSAHGEVTIPSMSPFGKAEVRRNSDGEWICTSLPEEVRNEIIRSTPLRQPQ